MTGEIARPVITAVVTIITKVTADLQLNGAAL
jgi:hypothetical protein